MMPRCKIAVMVAGLLCAGMHSRIGLADTELTTYPATLSQNIKAGDRVGKIRFLGMLQLSNSRIDGKRVSQISALAWDDDEQILYALSDKGSLFHFQPMFEGDILTGLKLRQAVTLRDLGSDKPLRGWRIDVEGMEIVNSRNGRRNDTELIISHERVPEIVRYRPDGFAIGRYSLPTPINEVESFHEPNKLLESVCIDPKLGVMTIPEVPLKNEREGYNRIFGIDGTFWLYPLEPGNRITAMECRGKGEVLVLEQNYQHPFGRVIVILKRVRLSSPPASDPLNPEILFTLDSRDGIQIDNFEGLAHHRGNRYFMVSDNNDLFVQRTLLMYFELLDE